VAVDRPVVGAGLFSEVNQLQKMLDAGQLASPSKENKADVVGVQFAVDSHRSHAAAGLQFAASARPGAHFVAKIGWNPRRCRNTFIDCWPQGRSIRFLIVRRNLMPAVDLTSLGSLQARQKQSAIPCSGTACTFRHSTGVSQHQSQLGSWLGGWVVGEWDCFFGSLLTMLRTRSRHLLVCGQFSWLNLPTELSPMSMPLTVSAQIDRSLRSAPTSYEKLCAKPRH